MEYGDLMSRHRKDDKFMDLMTIAMYAAVIVAVVVIGVPLLKLILGAVVALVATLSVGFAAAILIVKEKLKRRRE